MRRTQKVRCASPDQALAPTDRHIRGHQWPVLGKVKGGKHTVRSRVQGGHCMFIDLLTCNVSRHAKTGSPIWRVEAICPTPSACYQSTSGRPLLPRRAESPPTLARHHDEGNAAKKHALTHSPSLPTGTHTAPLSNTRATWRSQCVPVERTSTSHSARGQRHSMPHEETACYGPHDTLPTARQLQGALTDPHVQLHGHRSEIDRVCTIWPTPPSTIIAQCP